MKRVILRGQMIAVLASLLVALLCGGLSFHATLEQEQEQTLLGMTQAGAALWDTDGDAQEQLQALVGGSDSLRATLIAADGTVLADTEGDPAQMENHLDRPEIQAAADGNGEAIARVSETLGRTMLYAAARTSDGNYLRLAREGGDLIRELTEGLPALALGGALALLLGGILADRLTEGMLEPVRSLTRSLRQVRSGAEPGAAVSCPFPELQEMADQIQELTRELGAYLRKLEEEHRKTTYLLNHLEEGFLLLDERQNIVMVNQSAQRQLACGPECTGQSLGRVIPNPRLIQQAREVQAGRDVKRMDLTSHGRIYAVRFRRTGAETGLEGKLILTLNDVTEERRSSRMRQEFFSNASHELKTPITAIRGNTELLCSGLPLTEEQRQELLRRIGTESERMSSVIEDIIMLSRLESGTIRQERELVAFDRVVTECAGEWEGAAAAAQVTVTCRTEPMQLWASRKNLRELADNLISNAVKYNRPGGAVEIALTRTAGGCCLMVRNDGELIPPDQQRRVFERFYRVDKGRSRSAGGTGLGLSIVKHVVESMDGRVRLESEQGLGTRFTVFLPIREEGER